MKVVKMIVKAKEVLQEGRRRRRRRRRRKMRTKSTNQNQGKRKRKRKRESIEDSRVFWEKVL